MPKKGEYIKFKNSGRKKKRHSRFMQISKAFQCLKIMKSETQMSFIAKNIKNMLLVVMIIN